jgi:hypothetical protein
MTKSREDIYLSAMRGVDGTINVGYLVLFRSGRAVIIICAIMTAGAIVQAYFDPLHVFPFDALGKGIGLILAAYGLELGSIGAFLWGDSKQAPIATTTTTQTTTVPAP